MNHQAISLPEKQRAKSPAWAALFSLLLPGLGQIHCRQDNKGVFLLGMSLLGHWSTNGASSWFLCPAMALDAWMIAQKLRSGAPVQRWEFFPAIKPLNSLPPRVILLAIAALIAALTVIHIRQFAEGYPSPG